MTAHEAAHSLLIEEGKPLSSRELARRMLDRRLVSSKARSPIDSLAQTIEKNIRDKAYNRPQLVFVRTADTRLVGLPSHGASAASVPRENSVVADVPRVRVPTAEQPMTLELPPVLTDKVKLAALAGLAATLEQTAALLLQRGLEVSADEIAAGLRSYLSGSEAPSKSPA